MPIVERRQYQSDKIKYWLPTMNILKSFRLISTLFPEMELVHQIKNIPFIKIILSNRFI